jgi:hypothetical protein
MPLGNSSSPVTAQEDKQYDIAVRDRLKAALKNITERKILVSQQLTIQ